jgi:hypothetical protein
MIDNWKKGDRVKFNQELHNDMVLRGVAVEPNIIGTIVGTNTKHPVVHWDHKLKPTNGAYDLYQLDYVGE